MHWFGSFIVGGRAVILKGARPEWILEAVSAEQASIVWLVRSLYFHNSLVTALLDLGLVGIGLLGGAWALINTGSAAAALWTFFLLQALFSWIPVFDPKRAEVFRAAGQDPSFQAAHRVAVDAVRKLSQP
jgi:hypothetical protein